MAERHEQGQGPAFHHLEHPGGSVLEGRVWWCDEPTTLLDLRNIKVIEQTLRGLAQQVILLTHHLDTLAGFDRVLVMDAGSIVFDGAPDAAVAYYTELMALSAPTEGEHQS